MSEKKLRYLAYRSAGGRGRRLLRLRRWRLPLRFDARRRFHLCRDAGRTDSTPGEGENVPGSSTGSTPGEGENVPGSSTGSTSDEGENAPADSTQNTQTDQISVPDGHQLVDFQEEDYPLPWEHGLYAGEIVMSPGESEKHGNVVITCTAGPVVCVVNVGTEGLVTYNYYFATPSFTLIPPGGFPSHPVAAAQRSGAGACCRSRRWESSWAWGPTPRLGPAS